MWWGISSTGGSPRSLSGRRFRTRVVTAKSLWSMVADMTNGDEINEFELAGRLAKARKLSAAALDAGLDRIDLEDMEEREWLVLCEAAGVKRKPSEKTKAATIAFLPGMAMSEGYATRKG